MPEKVRNNKWLEEKMYEIWEDHFADVPRKNLVLIKFGKASVRQLGSIRWATQNARIKSIMRKKTVHDQHLVEDDKRITIITITSKFKDTTIPEFIVNSTIAHELTHYAHGFSSPLSQSYAHPHKGGIIRKELTSRGLGQLHKESKKWLKENWRTYVNLNR